MVRTSTPRKLQLGRLALLLAVGSPSLLVGCYESHIPALPGERYSCGCRWTVRMPIEAELECRPDGMGGVTCETTTTVSTTGHTVTRSETIRPCFTFLDDPATVCNLACSDPAFTPPLTESTTVAFSSHSGTAVCEDEGGSRYLTPDVPDTASRRGFVVGDQSTFQTSISGVGTSDMINLVDGTEVSIQGGNCEIGECDLQVRDAEFRAPPFSIDGHAATGVTLRLADAEASSGTYRNLPTPPSPDTPVDEWFLQPTSVLNMEFFGHVEGFERDDGRPAGLEFAWHTVRGDIQLDRRAAEQFMTFRGDMSTVHDFGDGDRTVSVTGDFYVRFFSGHPTSRMSGAVDSRTDMLILDSSGSSDMLGGSIRDFRWLVSRASGNTVLALGPRVAIPAPVWAMLKAENDAKVCLEVQDDELMWDQTCFGLEMFPTPTVPPPAVPCGDLATTFPYAQRFAKLLQASELLPSINKFQELTIVLPDDDAMSDMKDDEYNALLNKQNKKALQQFVLNQMWKGVYYRESLSKLLGALPLGGGKVDPGKQPEDTRIPDVDCGDSGVLHVSSSRSRTL